MFPVPEIKNRRRIMSQSRTIMKSCKTDDKREKSFIASVTVGAKPF